MLCIGEVARSVCACVIRISAPAAHLPLEEERARLPYYAFAPSHQVVRRTFHHHANPVQRGEAIAREQAFGGGGRGVDSVPLPHHREDRARNARVGRASDKVAVAARGGKGRETLRN